MAPGRSTPGFWRNPALRSAAPIGALAVIAPAIPELLTGSTPITTLFVNPLFFLLDFAGLVALYGGGALLVREFAAYYRKGWGSILLLGAAYGIVEEGFAVHTFFELSGPPANALALYGHAFGVNWLWALGLSIFHATYSIALPILFVGLLYPDVRGQRWLGRGGIAVAAGAYGLVVALFAVSVGHGPSPTVFALFLGIVAGLVALAYEVPRELVRLRPGPTRWSPWAIATAAALPFVAWTVIEILAGHPVLPAAVAALILVLVDGACLLAVLRFAGSERPEWTAFWIATGMLGVLFVWDVGVEFVVPGILLVSVVFGYLLYRIRNRLREQDRAAGGGVPTGATGGP
jgi:hypothetical protein